MEVSEAKNMELLEEDVRTANPRSHLVISYLGY